MRIGLDDIDTHIAQEVQYRLTAPEHDFLRANIYWGGLIRQRHQRDPSEDERRAFELNRRRKGHNWKSIGFYVGGDGRVHPMPGPSFRRLRKVARALVSQ